MNERLHLLIHFGEVIGVLVLLLTTWRNSDQIHSIVTWARGVDHFLNSGEDDQQRTIRRSACRT